MWSPTTTGPTPSGQGSSTRMVMVLGDESARCHNMLFKVAPDSLSDCELVAPLPEGVPDRITSPGANSKYSERYETLFCGNKNNVSARI